MNPELTRKPTLPTVPARPNSTLQTNPESSWHLPMGSNKSLLNSRKPAPRTLLGCIMYQLTKGPVPFGSPRVPEQYLPLATQSHSCQPPDSSSGFLSMSDSLGHITAHSAFTWSPQQITEDEISKFKSLLHHLEKIT